MWPVTLVVVRNMSGMVSTASRIPAPAGGTPSDRVRAFLLKYYGAELNKRRVCSCKRKIAVPLGVS